MKKEEDVLEGDDETFTVEHVVKFRITVDDLPINLSRIANSGQMFRWTEYKGAWYVNDGDHGFAITEEATNVFMIKSEQSWEDFHSLFRLETDQRGLHKSLIERGPEIEPFLAQRQGLRMLRPNCRTEVLFSFLCSSCNHITRITSMVWNLAKYGEQGFPTIKELKKVTEQQLREQGFGYRGATIPRVAQILHSNGGERYLDDLAKGTYHDARNPLHAIEKLREELSRDEMLERELSRAEHLHIHVHQDAD